MRGPYRHPARRYMAVTAISLSEIVIMGGTDYIGPKSDLYIFNILDETMTKFNDANSKMIKFAAESNQIAKICKNTFVALIKMENADFNIISFNSITGQIKFHNVA